MENASLFNSTEDPLLLSTNQTLLLLHALWMLCYYWIIDVGQMNLVVLACHLHLFEHQHNWSSAQIQTVLHTVNVQPPIPLLRFHHFTICFFLCQYRVIVLVHQHLTLYSKPTSMFLNDDVTLTEVTTRNNMVLPVTKYCLMIYCCGH